MSAREELAGIIGGKLITRSSMTETADAVLAAGYRKPRVITTTEELDALPDHTVVMDTYGTGCTIYRNNPHLTKESFHFLLNSPDDFVTVLHEPEAQS